MARKLELLLVLVLCCPGMGHAAVVNGLYEAEVPVPDQSESSQKQGVAAALQKVLVKLTGDRKVLGRSGAAGLLERPERYVQQYKFHTRPVIRNNQLSLDQQLYLWVSFNADTLDKAMRDHDIPQWGRVRPVTLIWLVAQQGENRSFVGLEDEQGYTGILDGRARQRGIPLVHPLLDTADRSVVKESDITAGFMYPVQQASQRYVPDTILMGNIKPESAAMWTVQWTALINSEPLTWTDTGDTAETVLQAGIDRLADELALRFVHAPGYAGESGLEIVVKDISNFDQYSRVLKYLRTLNSVVAVEVENVDAAGVTYSLTAAGGEVAVLRAIELGRTLESLGGGGSPYRLVQ